LLSLNMPRPLLSYNQTSPHPSLGKKLIYKPGVLRTHLPILVRPWLVDMRHLSPEKTETLKIIFCDASCGEKCLCAISTLLASS